MCETLTRQGVKPAMMGLFPWTPNTQEKVTQPTGSLSADPCTHLGSLYRLSFAWVT